MLEDSCSKDKGEEEEEDRYRKKRNGHGYTNKGKKKKFMPQDKNGNVTLKDLQDTLAALTKAVKANQKPKSSRKTRFREPERSSTDDDNTGYVSEDYESFIAEASRDTEKSAEPTGIISRVWCWCFGYGVSSIPIADEGTGSIKQH